MWELQTHTLVCWKHQELVSVLLYCRGIGVWCIILYCVQILSGDLSTSTKPIFKKKILALVHKVKNMLFERYHYRTDMYGSLFLLCDGIERYKLDIIRINSSSRDENKEKKNCKEKKVRILSLYNHIFVSFCPQNCKFIPCNFLKSHNYIWTYCIHVVHEFYNASHCNSNSSVTDASDRSDLPQTPYSTRVSHFLK